MDSEKYDDRMHYKSDTDTDTSSFIKDSEVSELQKESETEFKFDTEHYKIGKPIRIKIRASIIHD